MYCRVINWKSADISEVRAASIIRAIMEAARTSETSGDIQLRTRQYIPGDSELHPLKFIPNVKANTTWKQEI
jgi:hypothetical protein